MTAKEALEQLVSELPESRLKQLLDYARLLSLQEEAQAWEQFGRSQLARAYGPDEPDYTEADLKPELNR
jgi:hypothetical protein